MSKSDVIFFFTTVLICTVSNQKVQLMEGTPVLLTKEFNVKPSPIVPVVSFTTEDLVAAPIPQVEVQSTQPLPTPVQATKLSPGNIASTNVLKTASVYEVKHPMPSYTFEPTTKLAPNMVVSATEGVWNYREIAPTRVVKSQSDSDPFTLPPNNLRPPTK